MANRNLTVTLADETCRLIETSIASGEFCNASDVIQTAIERLCTSAEDFEDWIRREAIPALEELEDDPSSGFTLEQVFAQIDKQESSHFPKAS